MHAHRQIFGLAPAPLTPRVLNESSPSGYVSIKKHEINKKCLCRQGNVGLIISLKPIFRSDDDDG